MFAIAVLIHWDVVELVAIVYVCQEWPIALIIIGIGHLIFNPNIKSQEGNKTSSQIKPKIRRKKVEEVSSSEEEGEEEEKETPSRLIITKSNKP